MLLWLAVSPERLGAATTTLADPAIELLLSAASAWEIGIKYGTGRLPLPEPPEVWLASRAPRLGVTHLPVSWQDGVAVAALPALHRDPFDRLLVAQARRLDLIVATADPLVAAYDVEVLPVG
ncbi:MAG: type II toxin-antitoxin system VapC family toxin [Actinomycetota bacterium]|nr:type II toxin-antitoxin system VapC family toxin [Actinomycetota bacterium]